MMVARSRAHSSSVRGVIANDVLADRMLDVLHIAPTLGIAVLQPNKRSGDVGRHVFGVVNNNWLFAPGRHEDLDGLPGIRLAASFFRRTCRAGE
jgi:hypothetical protein